MSEVQLNRIDDLASPLQCASPKNDEICLKNPCKGNTTGKDKSDSTVNENIPKGNNNKKVDSFSKENESRNSSPEKSKKRSSGKKHRAGRNRKRKWKPYCKLTWRERKKLEEREARRAQRIRDEMSAAGLALAPYNTTQFLMNDHDIQEPIYDRVVHNGNKHSEVHISDDEYYSGSNDEDYINQQFMEDYESYHDQYLDSLSQLELAQEWVRLEDKIEEIEKQLLKHGTPDPEAEMAKIQIFREEIEKLAVENEELEKQNEELQRDLTGIS